VSQELVPDDLYTYSTDLVSGASQIYFILYNLQAKTQQITIKADLATLNN